jgi:NAD-dependent dihydropyrimidine dehydrogenase PreA subunit
MATRKIIEIDRDLCNGCGLCTTACAEGALALDGENKAVLVRELYCDGMGACLDVCPTDALKIIERESEAYDAQATREHVTNIRGPEAATAVHAGPGAGAEESASQTESGNAPTELSQWPIQLHLITPQTPYFKGADLLIAADCTAFARGSFHADLLKGRKLVVACPKLDDTGPYAEKLAELLRVAQPKSLTVAMMTVPCCSGLQRIVEQAVELSGTELPIHTAVVGLDGEIVLET